MGKKEERTIKPWKPEFTENGVGTYLRENREMRGYFQSEICNGICSEPTYSRIEAGKEAVDFQMLEALISRMGIEKSEYEFYIAGNDAVMYQHREEIKNLFEEGKYKEAEESLNKYNEKYIIKGKISINNQFSHLWRAILEQSKPQPDLKKARELLLKAIKFTVQDYQKKIDTKILFSDMELECMIEQIHCMEDLDEKKEQYEEFYTYFKWNRSREKSFPVPYRKLLRYYAKCLYKLKEFDACIRVCTEAIEELYGTSKEENRWELFCLRGKAREEKGMLSEEEKELMSSDFWIAYNVLCYLRNDIELTENDMMEEWNGKL